MAQLQEATNMASAAGEVQLDSVHLDGLQMNDGDAEELVSAITSSGLPIRNLSLASNFIGDAGAAAVAHMFDDDAPHGYRCILSSLNLRGNSIGSKGCKVLTERLQKNTTLKSLDLSSNSLGSEGGSCIGQMLAGNSTIERLVIRKADMTETGFTAVISALRERNNTVEDLSVGSQLVRSKEEFVASHVSRMLETPACPLKSLDLSSSGIGDDGAKILRGALTGHPTMRSLDLSLNRIGITGGQALAGLFLGDSSLLSSLCLRANLIGDEGAEAFKTVLLHSKTLITLDLRSNSINDRGLDALAEGMTYNTTVERLLVWGNHFGQASLRRFHDLAGGRFAMVGMSIDVHPFLVDGVFQGAEKSATSVIYPQEWSARLSTRNGHTWGVNPEEPRNRLCLTVR